MTTLGVFRRFFNMGVFWVGGWSLAESATISDKNRPIWCSCSPLLLAFTVVLGKLLLLLQQLKWAAAAAAGAAAMAFLGFAMALLSLSVVRKSCEPHRCRRKTARLTPSPSCQGRPWRARRAARSERLVFLSGSHCTRTQVLCFPHTYDEGKYRSPTHTHTGIPIKTFSCCT